VPRNAGDDQTRAFVFGCAGETGGVVENQARNRVWHISNWILLKANLAISASV